MFYLNCYFPVDKFIVTLRGGIQSCTRLHRQHLPRSGYPWEPTVEVQEKRDEKSEYFAVLNANRDNCYKSYNTSKKEKYTLEELIIISHTNSFPIKKNNV